MRLARVDTIEKKLVSPGNIGSEFGQKVKNYWENVRKQLMDTNSQKAAVINLGLWRDDTNQYKHIVTDADFVHENA
eukprot:2437621-Rhodomonas_salina.2